MGLGACPDSTRRPDLGRRYQRARPKAQGDRLGHEGPASLQVPACCPKRALPSPQHWPLAKSFSPEEGRPSPQGSEPLSRGGGVPAHLSVPSQEHTPHVRVSESGRGCAPAPGDPRVCVCTWTPPALTTHTHSHGHTRRQPHRHTHTDTHTERRTETQIGTDTLGLRPVIQGDLSEQAEKEEPGGPLAQRTAAGEPPPATRRGRQGPAGAIRLPASAAGPRSPRGPGPCSLQWREGTCPGRAQLCQPLGPGAGPGAR